MAKARYTVMFQTLLTPAQHAALSAAAAAEGVSMGDVMRDALDAWLRTIGPVSIEVSAVADDGAEENI